MKFASIKANYVKNLQNLVIRNTDTKKQRWDMVIMVLSLFNAFSVPLMICFDKDVSRAAKTAYDDINYVVDFCFFVDIFISFRTAFIDSKGNEECRSYFMAREYIQSNFPILQPPKPYFLQTCLTCKF